MPALNTLVKHAVPDSITGRVFGINMSAQYLGVFSGSVLGGQVAALFGIRTVFFVTGALLLVNAAWVWRTGLRIAERLRRKQEKDLGGPAL